MAKNSPTQAHVVPVIFEDGVLKPLAPVPLRNHERVDVAILSKAVWAKAFRNLLRSIHLRPSPLRPHEIEEQITRAREEVRKSRRRAQS